MSSELNAALRLHDALMVKHWDGESLIGPDPIGKINWRISRFVRSYLPLLPLEERTMYLQGQAYWIKCNLALAKITDDDRYLELAALSSDAMLERQTSDGIWLHPPIRGRRGFLSTVEGVWASLGLLAVHQVTGAQEYLDAAIRWYNVQMNRIGFQSVGDGMAANYYSHSTSIVPNVSSMLLWLCAELNRATGSDRFLEKADQIIQFIANSQLETGELPYEIPTRIHFMCFQYNAYQFLDLAEYFLITGDERIQPILSRLASYLSSGIMEDGRSRYSCHKDQPEVHYWTAALGAALLKADELGLGGYRDLSERAYERLLLHQKSDGGFEFSLKNYSVLKDRRSYPRYQAMILWHLLSRVKAGSMTLQHAVPVPRRIE